MLPPVIQDLKPTQERCYPCHPVWRVTKHVSTLQEINGPNTINGVRFSFADGSWGLVRASSNKPELVVVCESPVSAGRMMEVVNAVRSHLATYPEAGALQQVPEQ